MKKNIIINFISLAITACLLIIVMFSWYISNTIVSASGIVARTKDSDFVLRLERGTSDDSTDSWTWTPTTSLSITNMQPNDAFFFRFRIEANITGRINVKLSQITSILDDTITLGSDNKSVLVGGAKYFELDNTNKVVIKGENNSTLGTLYEYTNSKFELKDFLVQDTFYYYDYGLGTEEFYRTGTTYYTDDVRECPQNPALLDNISAQYTINQTGTTYGYFALEFNDALSLEEYIHLDGTLKEDSNLYQSQIFSIKTISVEALH